MDEKILKELSKLSTQIEAAKKEESILEGRIKEIESRLLKDYGFKTIDEAYKWVEKESKEIEDLEKEIEGKYQELKENYAW